MKIVRTVMRADNVAKVEIFQRFDGTYGFEEWHWQEQESAWCPTGSYSASFTDSPESALSEARGRVSWMENRPEPQ
jgi:hypothetical protein